MNDHYCIEPPALVSVSGGRTSAFMLAKIIEAHGGKLPPDIVPVFCNTGREIEATYQFLREIETRWTPIVWLEYIRFASKEESPHGLINDFQIVNFATASRDGTPFAQLIASRRYLPNPATRFCTSELKIRTSNRYAKHHLGWKQWIKAVGLRGDEVRRAKKIKGDITTEDIELPMFDAGHALDDVREFWARQDFDLNLPFNDDAYGNCDLCFLKGRDKLERVMREMPESAKWWIAQEESVRRVNSGSASFFRNDRPCYSAMKAQLPLYQDYDAEENRSLPCVCTE